MREDLRMSADKTDRFYEYMEANGAFDIFIHDPLQLLHFALLALLGGLLFFPVGFLASISSAVAMIVSLKLLVRPCIVRRGLSSAAPELIGETPD